MQEIIKIMFWVLFGIKLLIYTGGFAFASKASSAPKQTICGKVHGDFSPDKISIPWASIVTISNRPGFNIPATLVAPHLLLSMASWLTTDDNYDFVPFGELTALVGKQTLDDKHSWPYPIKSKVTHLRTFPGYKVQDDWYCREHDFMLFHLSEPAVSNVIWPICLPNVPYIPSPTRKNQNNSGLWLLGWTLKSSGSGLVGIPISVKQQSICESTFNSTITKRCNLQGSRYCAEVKDSWLSAAGPCLAGGGIGICDQNLDEDNTCFLVGHGIFEYGDGKINPPRCTKDTTIYSSGITDEVVHWIKNNTRCGHNNFTCDNGQCAPLSSLCNAVFDCTDKSDENPLVCGALNFCQNDETFCVLSEKCVRKGESCEVVPFTWITLFLIPIGIVAVIAIIVAVLVHKNQYRIMGYTKLPGKDPDDGLKEFKIWNHNPLLRPLGGALIAGSSGVVLSNGCHYIRRKVKIKRIPSSSRGIDVLFDEARCLIEAEYCQNVLRYYECWIETSSGGNLLKGGTFEEMLAELNTTPHTSTSSSPLSYNIFLVTEYLDTRLDEWLANNEPSMDQLVDSLHQISNGLYQLHEHNILHMDIRPMNIMAKFNDNYTLTWKIIDLGLSKLLRGPRDVIDTIQVRTGDSLYYSPEKVRLDRITMKSDVFALGLVFLEVITEKGPWQERGGKGKGKILNLVRAGKLQEARSKLRVKAGVNESGLIMNDVIIPMLAMHPNQRCNMGEVVGQIERCRGQQSVW